MPESAPLLSGQQASSEVLLATLLHLIKRSQEVDTTAGLRFLLVNETHALVPYRQAVLWSRTGGVEALSGVSAVERQAPYVHWLERWCRQGEDGSAGTAALDLRVLSESAEWRGWNEWLPPFLATVEIRPREGFAGGCLLLARERPFKSAELSILQQWADAWCVAYASHQPRHWFPFRQRSARPASRRRWLARFGAVSGSILLASLPVKLSVLAPAELVPLQPAIVRAPMDGIVDEVLVQPNQQVEEQQPLFAFDRVALASQLEVAERALTTAQTEYRRNAQRALFDPESKAELAVLQSQIAERRVDVEYLRELNQRSLVLASRSGVVLFEDADELIGRPVVTGERIMVVADEHRTQIESWVSPADMVSLPIGAAVQLYLAANPVDPVLGRISYVAHMAERRPDGQYAYRVRAELDVMGSEQAVPRVGLKGTAKLEGESVPLLYWILRRPWSALRGWLGV